MSNQNCWPKRAAGVAGVTSALLLSTMPSALLAQEVIEDLAPIVIENPDEAADGAVETLTPNGVTEVAGEVLTEQYGGDIGTALRATPGAFTRSPSDNPTVAVNIRGLQGFGRVNTMIDGIPQTFRNMSGHNGSFDDQVFVDPGLIATADIAKGAVAGADGLGALAGAANFRTIGIDDVLGDGANTGGMVKLTFGNNGKDVAATLAGAIQGSIESGAEWGAMAAVSGYNNGPFQDGHGTETSEYYQDEPRSILAKLRFRPNADTEINLTAQSYDNTFFPVSGSGYIWDTQRQSVSADLHYNPANALIDVTANVYWQDLDFNFPEDDDVSSSTYIGRAGTDRSTGANISNTSRLALSGGSLEMTYGLAIARNDFEVNELGGSNADGELTKSGAFFNGVYILGAWDLAAGLRYDAYELSGVIDEENVSRDDGEWNPSLSATYHLNDALSLSASYARTMRAPTATEMFYGGGSHATGSSTIYTNPDLEAEKADTFELGLAYASGPFWGGLTAFRSDIEDYITYQTDADDKVRYINVDGTTKMQGVELSAGYDGPRFFGSLALTVSDTDQPIAEQAGFGQDQYGELPDAYATLDLGMKLLDGDAKIGARVRYVGDSKVATMQSFGDMSGTLVDLDDYTLIDLYGSWQVTDTFEVFASVENLTDTFYREAGTGIGDTGEDLMGGAGIGGRGRTIQIGGTFRF